MPANYPRTILFGKRGEVHPEHFTTIAQNRSLPLVISLDKTFELVTLKTGKNIQFSSRVTEQSFDDGVHVILAEVVDVGDGVQRVGPATKPTIIPPPGC